MTAAAIFPHPARADFLARARRELELDARTRAAVADCGHPPGGPLLAVLLAGAVLAAAVAGDLGELRRARARDARTPFARALRLDKPLREVAP